MSAVSTTVTSFNATINQSGLANPETKSVTISSVNIEQSYALPNNTKHFKIFNLGNYILKVSYQSTESGTNYFPVYPYDSHEVYGISQTTVTIYIQSPGLIKGEFKLGASQILEAAQALVWFNKELYPSMQNNIMELKRIIKPKEEAPVVSSDVVAADSSSSQVTE